MSADLAYDYAVIRVVPRVDREEFLNVGVIVSCTDAGFLQACIELDVPRVQAFAPDLDVDGLRESLSTFPRVCEGGTDAGPIGQLPARQRFLWLVAPRSTVIQVSPVHTGRTSDPHATLQRLMDRVVRLRHAT